MAKTERINIRIEPEVKEQLTRLAEEENRTVTNYIENLILREIKKRG